WKRRCGLERTDSLSMRALGALTDLELDLLVLLEGTEARALDLGVVDEDVSGAICRSDEAEALLSVEPLHSSLCHVKNLFLDVEVVRRRRMPDNRVVSNPRWTTIPRLER